jgi:hypothetical protein
VDENFIGAEPSDLSIKQPTKVELFICRTAAKAIDLTIPRSLLIRTGKAIK